MGLAGEPVRGPFPDIPGHILDSEWRSSHREPADGSGFNIAVRPINAATRHAPAVCAEGRRWPGWVVSPRIAPSIGAAGRKLPLRFGRQTQSLPAAIGPGINGRDLDHRVIMTSLDGIVRPMRKALIGALAPDPLSLRSYPPPAFPLAVGRIAGRFDKDCEGLVGHLRPH